MSPVVAGLLISCAKPVDFSQSPCLELLLSENQLEISASSAESTCKEITYDQNPDGTINVATRNYQRDITNDAITDFYISVDNNSVERKKISQDNYSLRLSIPITLTPGFHEIQVTACNERNYCTERRLPVYSYGQELTLSSRITNDQKPPEINAEFIFGNRKTFCRDCRATDISGITSIEISQDETKKTKIYDRYTAIADFSPLIRTLEINPEKSFFITAYTPTNHTTLEVSMDGVAEYTGVGGP